MYLPADDVACHEELPEMARRGLEFFNAGEYFEAHEALETAWRDETRPIRDLYRAVLQVAVGYYHLLRGNSTGARKLFQRSRVYLDRLPDTCQGIDLHRLRADMERVETEMRLLGPAHIAAFNRALLKPVVFTTQP